jgi:hypothetical protein
MHIQKIEVANVAGLARADITLGTGVLLVAGDNMSGKTSLVDAISMAITGVPSRVTKKKDLDQLLHDGAKKGRATVYSGGEILGEIKLPKGEFAGPELKNSEYLPLLLDPSKFAAMTNDERRSLLFKLTGCNASMKTIEPMLTKRGINMALFGEAQAMLRSGFPAAEKYAQDKAREAKGAWKATTGETWGSEKANGWELELPNVAEPTAEQIKAANSAVTGTQKDIADGQQFLGKLKEQQRNAETASRRITELRERAEGLGRAQAKLASTDSDLAEWTERANKLNEQVIAASNNAGGCECPSCGANLKMEGGALVAYQPGASTGNLTALKEELKKATDARDMMARTQRNDLALVTAAELAGVELAAAKAAAGEPVNESKVTATVDALNALQQRLASEQAKVMALTELRAQIAGAAATTKKASTFHTDVTEWLEIAGAMAPDGIPGELLAMALAPINQSLEMLAGLAGWPLVSISNDIEIKSRARAYSLCSESEQWRANALIAIAIAQLTGLKLVVLDRFDVLMLKARGQLLGMLCKLIQLGNMDTIIMLGTMKEIPAALPAEVTGVWVKDGIAE